MTLTPAVRQPSPAERLYLADGRDADDLGAYLARLLHFDRRAAVRLRADGLALGVFSQPPFGVIALRAVPLTTPAELDLTVPAGQLLDGLAPGEATVVLPPPVTGPAWAGLVPPRTGWKRLAAAPAASVVHAVRTGVGEFKKRAEAVAATERTREFLDGTAEDVWGQPVLAGVPLRAAHAAHALGFLTAAGEVTVHATAGWLRLDAAHGCVAIRTGPRLGLALHPRPA